MSMSKMNKATVSTHGDNSYRTMQKCDNCNTCMLDHTKLACNAILCSTCIKGYKCVCATCAITEPKRFVRKAKECVMCHGPLTLTDNDRCSTCVSSTRLEYAGVSDLMWALVNKTFSSVVGICKDYAEEPKIDEKPETSNTSIYIDGMTALETDKRQPSLSRAILNRKE
jgi:hypothetical protein